jgi:hypothetical protein
MIVAALLLTGSVRAVEVSRNGEYALGDFGDIRTAASAQATLEQACRWIIDNGGGVLVVPTTAPEELVVQNSYQNDRESGPTVTILDRRKGYEITHLPAVGQRTPTGWYGAYDYRLINMQPRGLPFQGTHEMQGLRNAVVRGASSYMQLTSEAVEKGADRRIYVPSIRGIFVGQYLTLTGQRGAYQPPFDRIWVKSIGWDAERKLNYLVADLEHDHPAGCILYNKHVTGSMNISSTANADNQTMELQVTRRQYAHGDSFLISGNYIYQGDVFSGLGDEQGVVLNAEVMQDPDPFHSVVESVDWADDALVFAPGPCNVQKLATSRAIINMNSNKWITGGHVVIVPPEDWGGHTIHNPAYDAKAFVDDGIDLAKFSYTFKKDGEEAPSITTWDGHPLRRFTYAYQNKAYPSLVDGWVNNLGGAIIGSADCGWTEDVVGRFFAVADAGECLTPGAKDLGVVYQSKLERTQYRWYLIKQFRKNADGTCRIKIERIRYAAGDAGAPNLYNADNYTWEGHVRPLSYIIAPGAYAYDVGDGWRDRDHGVAEKSDPRIIRVVPNADRGTAFDFAAGDPIEQAIGADPALPMPIRVRVYNNVPDTMAHGMIELINWGTVSMSAGINLVGGGHNRDAIANRKDRKPFYGTGLHIGSVVGTGVRFGADVTEAALLFEQPNQRAQPLLWRHTGGETTLTVDPRGGEMSIAGSPLRVASVQGIEGLSATTVSARNLRGMDVAVPKGAKTFTIQFGQPEADARYALNIQPNWLTQDAVIEKTANGFTVEFSGPAPAGAALDWQLIR